MKMTFAHAWELAFTRGFGPDMSRSERIQMHMPATAAHKQARMHMPAPELSKAILHQPGKEYQVRVRVRVLYPIKILSNMKEK